MTLEPVLFVLLATSFTCVGLLSLWSAWSPRHWFLRAAVFLAVLSPLLLVPAYEPFVAFALQGIVVACGTAARRWLLRRRQKSEAAPAQSTPVNLRFSLSTLLLLMALVAVLTPIAIKLPRLDVRSWVSVAAIGAACGLTTLAAARMSAARRAFVAWPVGVALAVAIGFAVSQVDWFARCTVLQITWPAPNPIIDRYSNASIKIPTSFAFVWPAATLSICILLSAILLLLTVATAYQSRLAKGFIATTIALVAAFPAYVLWQLLHPLPVPHMKLPNPNGYDDVVAAGRMVMGGSPILNSFVEPTSTAQLAAEVKNFSAVYGRLHLALSRQCQVPIWPSDGQPPITALTFADVQAVRAAARASDRYAQLAQQEGRFHEAAMSSIDTMRLGQATSHGGLVVHYLVGIAIEGIGQYALFPPIAHLDAQSCREAVQALEKFERQRPPVDEVVERNRAYEQHTQGWYGRLQFVFDDVSESRRNEHWAIGQATARTKTFTRLLIVELALRQYKLENGGYPDRLAALVPKYLATVPIDAYSTNQSALCYKSTADGYLLYSLGFDCDDDGGRPSTRESGWLDDGDMRLDSYATAYEEETTTTDSDNAPAQPGSPTSTDTPGPQ